ncbi:polysaccharide deacetylase 2 family uncharacterized protein YibQ [Pacificibacter maritimus]|uniref:Polysaccharide deacetylase 2 family uncharacterized protein YibQ n=1 Tax=Pacificibacter maritimus TaxID=762213 RepID=A0A3N4VE36_9RHOB|nr:divergent polysaccharide deacetylase family protein [Pacificibacter maritimus]RPE71204.1 polysaccharide deacetylase 2 family uncharacterized protein YibQ [Pacificibacter maritimus]
MGRGILTGLAWGTVVCVGIVTVANQVVDSVSVASISPPMTTSETTPPIDSDISDAPLAVETETGRDENQAADPAVSDDTADAAAGADTAQNDATDDATTPDPLDTEMTDETARPSDVDLAAQGAIAQETAQETAQEDIAAPRDFNETPPQTQVDAPALAQTPMPQDSAVPNVESDTPVLGTPQGQELAAPAPSLADADQPQTNTDMAAESSMAAPVKKIQPQGQKTLGTKVGSFTDRTDSLKSERLPSVALEDAPVVVAEDLPAIVAHAAPFSKLGSAPNMSIVLVDIGDIDPTEPQLKDLPFPVTFAVDALAPGATARAQLYRDAGLEVMALIGLPDGASAQDVAQTLSQAAQLVPTSIGFLDVPSASFQTSREIAAQVVASSGQSGHGIVTFPSGLNALMQESQRAQQPAATVFRDFDGKDQNVAAMKRFLDQAAFRAGIDEEIVLVGRSKPDTLQALVEWSLGNRAATVEMVPVSFLLTSPAP